MKNSFKLIITLFAISIFTFSCLDDNDNENYVRNLKGIAIDSVKIPQDIMSVYTTQTIQTYTTYPTPCEGFYDYDYVIDGNYRYVTTIAYQTEGNCSAQTYVGRNMFNFRPLNTGTFTFKFWNGTDSQGNDLYITKQIVVEQ